MYNLFASMVGTGMNKSANSKAADQATAPSLDLLDMAGYNYASGRYPLEGKAHPERVIFGSETFPQDIAKNWEMVKQYPYLVGDLCGLHGIIWVKLALVPGHTPQTDAASINRIHGCWLIVGHLISLGRLVPQLQWQKQPGN